MHEIIVVVDDAPDVRRVAEVSLQRAGGFEVFSADSGEAGLALVRAHHPQLVLLDVMMPRMSGPQLLAEMREDRSLDDIKVAFMSAVCNQAQVTELEATSAVGLISKPFRPIQLVAQVREFLRKEKHA